MMRLIPPVAVPSGLVHVAASVLPGSHVEFRERALREGGFDRFDLFPSGRSALSSLLLGWKRDGRDEVVIPAYTCWSVAASIVRAGLRIRAVDVDPLTLDYRADALAAACGPRTLALLAVQLFARTCDTDRIVALAESCGAHSIDDAAQALPERRSGADAAILSFGRGKPLALGGGGALLTAAGRQGRAERMTERGGLFSALRAGLTSVLGHPACYRLPRLLPFLGIGRTIYNPNFDMDAPFFRWQARLGVRLQSELESAQQRRSAHASRLMRAVEQCAGWTLPARQSIATGPLRLPVLAPDRRVRDRARARMLRLGVDASAMYPGSIARIAGIDAHLASAGALPGADELSDRLLTLPTYPTLTARDLQRVADVFVTAAGEAG